MLFGVSMPTSLFPTEKIEDLKTGLRNQLVMKTLVLLKLEKLIHTICIDGVIVLIAMASTVEKATLFIRKLLLNCSFLRGGVTTISIPGNVTSRDDFGKPR